jgi:glycosyltransferase involved in cell wall biosynthesis
MNQPLISICIPTYNQTIHLKKLLATIFNQKDVNLEIIVTDDSTTEDVENLIKETNAKFSSIPIKYIKNNPSLGAPQNWNLGMSLANGEFIKIMHHDQWFEDDYALKKQLNEIIDSKNTFVFSAVKNNFRGRIFNFNITKEEFEAIIKEPEKLILANLIGGPSAILFPRSANIFFDEKIIWLVDIEFYLQLFKKGYKVKFINETLYTSMTDFDSLTNNNLIDSEKQLYEYSYLYNKYIKQLDYKARINYFIGIYKILILPLKRKNYLIQLFRFLKRIV